MEHPPRFWRPPVVDWRRPPAPPPYNWTDGRPPSRFCHGYPPFARPFIQRDQRFRYRCSETWPSYPPSPNSNPFGENAELNVFQPACNSFGSNLNKWMPCNGNGLPMKRNDNFHNINRGNRNNKRQRVDKRDLPENNKFYCDTCDRGFKTDEKLKEHISQHMKCSVVGCNYIAAPKLIQLHYSFQHRTGLAKKIWQLESMKEINSWVSERKKNFPTAENIARKKQELSKRQERGEVLNDLEFGKMKGKTKYNKHLRKENDYINRERGRGSAHKRGSRGNKRWQSYKSEKQESVIITDEAAKQQDFNPIERKLLPEEDPLSLVLRDNEDNANFQCKNNVPCVPDQKLHDLVTATLTSKRETGSLGGALGSLASTYNDECDAEYSDVENETNKWDANASKSFNKQRALIPKARLTLLQKLLAPAVRHERNVLFQCIRYITQNNFFDQTDDTFKVNHEFSNVRNKHELVDDDEVWDVMDSSAEC